MLKDANNKVVKVNSKYFNKHLEKTDFKSSFKEFCCKVDSGTLTSSPLLFSLQRSAEFRLPDISLSSLDALLQTVSQKLGRKRRGGDEGPWRRVQSDHLLTTVSEQRLREKSVGQQNDRCTDNRNPANMFVWWV